MKSPIVQSLEPVCLVGAGEIGAHDLEQALRFAPLLVAADGGAGKALQAGYEPVAVIGDLDSLAPEDRDRFAPENIFPINEQDSTDFDKALRSIAAPMVLAVGFLGGRIDHQLAAFSTLLRHADRACVLLGPHEVIFHAPRFIQIGLMAGDIVSLFPMLPVTGRSNGLEWPIDGLRLAPGGRIGTSNRALGRVQLWTDGPGMLVIAPRTALAAVMQAFATVQKSDRWPGRDVRPEI